MSALAASPPAPRRLRRVSFQRWGDTLAFVAVLLLLWELASYVVGWEDLASPWRTLQMIGRLFGSASFWPNVAATGQVFLYALAITLIGGLLLGLLLGYFRLAGEVFDPLIGATYAIPKITLYPIILLVFGLTIGAKVAFGVLHGIFPMIIFTMSGVRGFRPVLLRVARIMRLSPGVVMRHVLVPAAMPEIFTGFRLSFSLTLFGTLIGEMFASDRGLRFLLMRGIEQGDSAIIMSISLMLFLLSSLTGWVLLQIDHRLHRYRATTQPAGSGH